MIVHTIPAARGLLNSDVHTHANAHRLTGPNLLRISPYMSCAHGTRPMKGISARVVHNCSHTGFHIQYMKATRIQALKLESKDVVLQGSILVCRNLSPFNRLWAFHPLQSSPIYIFSFSQRNSNLAVTTIFERQWRETVRGD